MSCPFFHSRLRENYQEYICAGSKTSQCQNQIGFLVVGALEYWCPGALNEMFRHNI